MKLTKKNLNSNFAFFENCIYIILEKILLLNTLKKVYLKLFMKKSIKSKKLKKLKK